MLRYCSDGLGAADVWRMGYVVPSQKIHLVLLSLLIHQQSVLCRVLNLMGSISLQMTLCTRGRVRLFATCSRDALILPWPAL